MDRHACSYRLIAALMSLGLPGTGQLWQQRTMRAAFFVGLWLIGWLIPLTVVYMAPTWTWVLLAGFATHVAAAAEAAGLGRRTRSARHRRRRHPYLP